LKGDRLIVLPAMVLEVALVSGFLNIEVQRTTSRSQRHLFIDGFSGALTRQPFQRHLKTKN